jgi:23S rRNA pseudouridine1911/1915/1917 synthase
VAEDLDEVTDDYSGEAPEDPDAASPLAASDLTIGLADHGLRLDVFLQAQFPQISRSRLQKWIEQGHVRVDDQQVKSSQTLRDGQHVRIQVPAAEPQGPWLAEPMDLGIVFEDAQVMVINKPSGRVVHPAAGHASGTLLNGLLAHCPELIEVPRAGIVHRLDRDTTGLMVVAKTVAAQFNLVQQLQARTVSRLYLALVWGRLAAPIRISNWMGRDPKDRQRMAVLPQGKGKEAITQVHPLAEGTYRGFPVTLVQCQLETGRTHQIRVHLQYLRHPLVGDATYTAHAPHASRLKNLEGGLQPLNRQALHAGRLAFVHPQHQQKVEFSADIPDDFRATLTASEISEDQCKLLNL